MAAPSWVANGTMVSGIGAVSPAWPAHIPGDIGVLVIESAGGEAANLTTPAGFAAFPAPNPSLTGAGTAGTRVTAYWCRATSAAMASPTVTDPGDHVVAYIYTVRGCIRTGNPYDVVGANVKAAASTSCSITGVTTTVIDTLVCYHASRNDDAAGVAFSAQANATLAGVAERFDNGAIDGNGGGLMMTSGVKATAGASGTMTATVTSSINAFLVIAFKPYIDDIGRQAADQYGRTVAADGYGSADIGGAYVVTEINGGGAYSVDGSNGKHVITAGGFATIYPFLENMTIVRDSEIYLEYRTDKLPAGGGSHYPALYLRGIGAAGAWAYACEFEVIAAAWRIRFGTVLNGVFAYLDVGAFDPSKAFAINTWYGLRFRATGSGTTTLAGKVWRLIDGEPLAFQYSFTNGQSELQHQGYAGYQQQLGSGTEGSVTTLFDNLDVFNPLALPFAPQRHDPIPILQGVQRGAVR